MVIWMNAELGLTVDAFAQTPKKTFQMPQESDVSGRAELVCSKAVELRSTTGWNHWQKCDVKEAVEDLLRLGQRNFSLKVVLNDHSGLPLAVVHPDQDDKKPFVEVRFCENINF